MLVIALISVIVLGAVLGIVAVAVLNRRSLDDQRPHLTAVARALLRRSHPQDTAVRRDYNEHAGGSRHIRTYPSWRDRLE